MPSIYDIKPQFQALLRPITRGLFRLGVTANQVTIAALFLSLLSGAAIYYWRSEPRVLLLLPAVLLLRMALNAIDGMLAREHDMQSSLGAILNELGDVVSDAGLYLPLAAVTGFDPRAIVGVVVLSIISEMAGVVAIQVGASRRYDGPLGKSDRAFAFGAVGLLLGCGVMAGAWVTWLLLVMNALLAVTIIQRCRKALVTTGESP